MGAIASATRGNQAQRLDAAVHRAEYRGWELTRVRLYTDGSRRVLLRRKKSRAERADSTRPDQPDL